MRKGISPLIATVLLIAFTIAIASIVAVYFTDFSRETTTEARETGKETIDCGAASLKVLSVNNDGTDLIVNVENTGQTNFNNLNLVVQNTSNSAFTNINSSAELDSGRIDSIVVEGWGTQSIHELTVRTDCPGLASTVENVSGTFKETF